MSPCHAAPNPGGIPSSPRFPKHPKGLAEPLSTAEGVTPTTEEKKEGRSLCRRQRGQVAEGKVLSVTPAEVSQGQMKKEKVLLGSVQAPQEEAPNIPCIHTVELTLCRAPQGQTTVVPGHVARVPASKTNRLACSKFPSAGRAGQ